jgi:hypothetical protein
MKLFILIIVLLLGSSSAKAQVLISLLLGDKLNSGKIEFGLDGGMNFATISGLNDVKSLRPFNLGFYFDIKTKNPSLLINTGVIVKSKAGRWKEELTISMYPFLSNTGLAITFM